MKLIADSGGTKTQWVLLDDGVKIAECKTPGLHPYFMNSLEMSELIHDQLLPKLGDNIPNAIYFYGAGCSKTEKQAIVKTALANFFPDAVTEVRSDLLGAARAALHNSKGIIGILGTGSNIGYYDGTNITEQIFSTGYLIGDEGSGAYLGKILLHNYFYKKLPAELVRHFEMRYGSDKGKILAPLYDSDFPNKYMAKFTMYLKDNRTHSYIQQLLEGAFNDFFDKLASQIQTPDNNIAMLGSIAKVFSKELTQVAGKKGFRLSKIIQEPMSGLLEYHRSIVSFT